MTQRREVEARLELYDDLSGILGAMRSFALAELRRVGKRELAQQQVMQAMSAALDDLSCALPPPSGSTSDIWLLFGSVRGFCSSFNEDVLRTWQAQQGIQYPSVVVGERLADLLPHAAMRYPVAGAEGGLDAPPVIDRILAALREAQRSAGAGAGLVACLRDEDGPRVQRLLPLSACGTQPAAVNPPLTNEPIAQVAAGVMEHFLFHSLLALLLRSIRVENHMRLLQMENALRHLERGSDELQRQRNRMRQEEIVEEIELMASGRLGL